MEVSEFTIQLQIVAVLFSSALIKFPRFHKIQVFLFQKDIRT